MPTPRARARCRAGSSARRVAALPLALAWIACASPAEVEPQRPTLSELIASIPSVADEGAGIGREEQLLATALAAHGPRAVQALLPLLDGPDASVRTFAGYAIREAEAAGPAELEQLIAASERSAGWLPLAIAHVGTPRAFDHLVLLLEREPEEGQASVGLARGGSRRATPRRGDTSCDGSRRSPAADPRRAPSCEGVQRRERRVGGARASRNTRPRT